MKKYLLLLIVSGYFITGLKAQSVSGEIKDLSINPDGSIWLASNSGIIYWTKKMQDDFGTILKLPDPKPDYFGDKHINIEKVLFFNKDTFFVCGYVGKDLVGGDKGTPNMVYLTMDGGNTWEMKEFNNKGAWVYDALAKKNGKAWMGGSDGDIYYTDDYGKNWKKLSSPFDDRTRLACLDKDFKTGVAGSLMGNELKISYDDFDKFESLKTPFDQKAYSNTKTKDESYSENQFFRIKIIGDSLIVVDQQHHVFYSAINNIKWQAL